MSTASPVECSETLPEVVRKLWPHFSEVIVSSKPFETQVLEHRQDAAVDPPGGDVFAAAVVDLEALVGEDALLQRLLGEQQDAGAAELLAKGFLPLAR